MPQGFDQRRTLTALVICGDVRWTEGIGRRGRGKAGYSAEMWVRTNTKKSTSLLREEITGGEDTKDSNVMTRSYVAQHYYVSIISHRIEASRQAVGNYYLKFFLSLQSQL